MALTPPTSLRALILSGGWPGHNPAGFSAFWSSELGALGVAVDTLDSPEPLTDGGFLDRYHLIVPNWTMGSLPDEAERELCGAVRRGAALAGFHGGMGDAFRERREFQFMVGGQFVAHPGDIIPYRVTFGPATHEITRGLSDFEVETEQYYMHVDPSNTVLATTVFDGRHGDCPWIAGTVMPVAWTRDFGAGRVFYSSLGHSLDLYEIPEVVTLQRRGFRWALGLPVEGAV